MKSIRLIVDGTCYLLPDTHQFYEFPAYIQRHKDILAAYARAAKSMQLGNLPDATEFKKITGIIGFPFDMHDPQLYALDRKIEITMEYSL